VSLTDPPNKTKHAMRAGAADEARRRTSPSGAARQTAEVKSRAARAIPFQDLETSSKTLARISERVSPALAAALPGLLAESPDPDTALLSFDRLLGESSEVVRLLNRHNFLAHYALVVFGHSRFLGETLIQNSDLLQSFLREKNLDHSFSREEFHESLARFRSRSFETDASLLLARFKRREYVRVMLRDVLKIAPLAETTSEISALADVLVEEALREADRRLQRRYGIPQHLDAEGRLVNTPFAILSLGKLGGNELNYSSDVDLMYIFGDGEEPPNAAVSNREYFIRLAQQVTELLSCMTREGAAYRIDLRLRPQGGEGELAVSLSQALRYYSSAAHDWERQALIKVRYSAGDSALAREFIRSVQPGVYTEQVNFAAIKTALLAREKMHKWAREHPDETIDIKIDRGGIRDIEFLVQCLQRVYGGGEPWLRSGGTLFSLQKLHDKRHISGKEFHDLTSAYEFLRHLEHRLQLREGQQTHRLPIAEDELRILHRSMEGFAPGQDRVPDLAAMVRQRMAAVAEIYQRIIYHQQTRTRHDVAEADFELRNTIEPATADHSNQQILERLASDSPVLHQVASPRDVGPQARKNLYRFLGSAFTSSERYAAVLRHPAAVERALALFESSDYLTDILIRHPEEIATLSEMGTVVPRKGSGYLFDNSVVPARISDPAFAYLASSPTSYAEKLSLLRQHYRHRVFAAGAKDITELRDVYESLGETTATAEDAIGAAYTIAGAPAGLSVLALGRLGSGEFDVLSDADVLFVCDQERHRAALTKSAEQMMQALAAYTRDGMVFPVDARLRPRGGEGELLVTPAQLNAYFQQEAQAWEALMYTKLRPLAGSRVLSERTMGAACKLFERFASDRKFLQTAREMRTKLENAEGLEKNFKTSPGAVYDIDFLTSFLLVKHRVRNKQGTLRDRIWRCAGSCLLDKSDAAALDHAVELFRTVEHVVRLVVGRARKWLPATEHAREVTQKLTSQILRRTFPRGLEAELSKTAINVRRIYDRLLV
jgi:glutamate-ammonia-ligase adenylyltransferase